METPFLGEERNPLDLSHKLAGGGGPGEGGQSPGEGQDGPHDPAAASNPSRSDAFAGTSTPKADGVQDPSARKRSDLRKHLRGAVGRVRGDPWNRKSPAEAKSLQQTPPPTPPAGRAPRALEREGPPGSGDKPGWRRASDWLLLPHPCWPRSEQPARTWDTVQRKLLSPSSSPAPPPSCPRACLLKVAAPGLATTPAHPASAAFKPLTPPRPWETPSLPTTPSWGPANPSCRWPPGVSPAENSPSPRPP